MPGAEIPGAERDIPNPIKANSSFLLPLRRRTYSQHTANSIVMAQSFPNSFTSFSCLYKWCVLYVKGLRESVCVWGVVMMGNTCPTAGCRRLGHPHIPLLPHDPHEIAILLFFQTLQQCSFTIGVTIRVTLEAFLERSGANFKGSKGGGGDVLLRRQGVRCRMRTIEVS